MAAALAAMKSFEQITGACRRRIMRLGLGADGLVSSAGPQFEFSYPAAFGTVSAGTNDGFEDRVAALRFSGLRGVEAALTGGFPLVDRQAVGGLYDSITLEIFP